MREQKESEAMTISTPITCTGPRFAWSGQPERHSNLKYSDATVDEWVALIQSGLTALEIAKRYRVPAQMVRDRMRRRGLGNG